MAAQCIASRLAMFLRGRQEGEIFDRIRREVADETSRQGRPQLRAADLLLNVELPHIFDIAVEEKPESWVEGTYHLLAPEETSEHTYRKEEE
jgi:hypothetical protein